MIDISNGQKSFKNQKILDNINISIGKGTIVGLAGPSGSGKSTLLRCLQGLDHFDEGNKFCEGKTGFVFQDFQLFPHMTVWQNLTYAPLINHKIQKDSSSHQNLQDIHQSAENFLAHLGLKEQKEKYPYHLSGGQKQRVALARALMMHPQILLCDEPTSGLDVATTEDVVNVLLSVHSFVETMVIASHDLDFLTAIADHILVLKQGRLIFSGSMKSLENPKDHLKKYYYSK